MSARRCCDAVMMQTLRDLIYQNPKNYGSMVDTRSCRICTINCMIASTLGNGSYELGIFLKEVVLGALGTGGLMSLYVWRSLVIRAMAPKQENASQGGHHLPKRFADRAPNRAVLRGPRDMQLRRAWAALEGISIAWTCQEEGDYERKV